MKKLTVVLSNRWKKYGNIVLNTLLYLTTPTKGTIRSIIRPSLMQIKKMDKVCIFAHFDAAGEIADYVLFYWNALKDAGFNIILVSASGSLKSRDLDAARNICYSIIVRENIGYDFVSWKVALREFPEVFSAQELLLANDSVFGPLFPIVDVLKKMIADPADVVGLTECRIFYPHAQSYFCLVKQRALPALRFFFSRVGFIPDKRMLIKKFEIGFSKFIVRKGFKLGYLIPFSPAYKAWAAENPTRAGRYNPTIDSWEELIQLYKYPFIKRELFVKNALSLDNVKTILYRNESSYQTSLIDSYLSSRQQLS